jgi:hypothetical protein
VEHEASHRNWVDSSNQSVEFRVWTRQSLPPSPSRWEEVLCVGLPTRSVSSAGDIRIAKSALDEPSREWNKTCRRLQASQSIVSSVMRINSEERRTVG